VDWPERQVTEVVSVRPQVRVNQLGYLPDRPKQATLISDAQEPVPFTVHDRRGVTVYTGFSQPWLVRPEPTSGLNVHVLDFSGLTLRGAGFRIESADGRSCPFEVTNRVYDMLRADALGFFYVMRSGTQVSETIAPGYDRPAGHAGRSPNRGDVAVPAWTGVEARRLYPGWRCEGTFDVSGGWYDAGDYGKYVTSGGIAVWQLLSTLGLLKKADSSLRLRELTDSIRSECRWQLDWLVRMQVPAGDPLSGLAFHRVHGTQWSPMPGWPHEDPTERVLQLEDDFYWAAVELWLTTDEEFYRQEVLLSAQHAADAFDLAGFDFDRVAAPARLDLALAGRHLVDYDRVVDSVRQGADRLLELQSQQPWGQPYAPTEGWHWGSNGRILNNLVVLAVAHLVSGSSHYADAVATGMDYLLGRNALGQGYITGYGTDCTCHQRTRQFGHDLDPALPPPPPGALAGGANSLPAPDFPYDPRLLGLPPQCCYLDEPTSEVTNDICIRWNAPLVWVATYLSTLNDQG
jgi:hypothetical protein